MRSPSFWLELLAALLLSLWLSGFTFGDLLPRHVVVLVDDSASMGANGTRAVAATELGAIADGLGVADEVTVVRSGTVAEVALGPRARPDGLRAFAANWQPNATAHALQPAIDLARDLAGSHGEIVVLTDRELADPGEDLRAIGCGVAAGNAAITALQRLPGEAADRLQVRVVGYGEVARGELAVSVDGREVARTPLSLPAGGGERRLELPLPRGAERVRVALPPDALAVDDVAWLLPEPPRTVAVCDRLPTARREALQLHRVFAALSGWRDEPDPAKAQVVLRERAQSPARDQIEVVFAASPGAVRGHTAPFVVDRSHPLLAGATFDGVAWQAGGGAIDGRVLVAKGAQVLLAEQVTARGRRLRFDLDPSRGNLVRAPDWPILFANLLELARPNVPGCRAHHLRVGDELVYRARGEPLLLVGPDDAVLAEARTGELAQVVRSPGIYSVRAANGEQLAEVAVRFVDQRESDLRGVRRFDRAPRALSTRAAAERLDPAPMRRLLAVLLVLVVLADWWVLRRGQA